MLQKVQLLVAGGVSEVVTGGTLATLLRSKGGIGEHYVITPHSFAEIGQGIAQRDGPLHVVQHGVHQSQTVGVVYQFHAGERLRAFKGGDVCAQVKEVIGLVRNISMGSNHKAERAASGVVAAFLRLRLH